MVKDFVNLYNNLVNLSRNKSLFSLFTDKDTFSDRILILLFHFAFFLRQYKGKTDKEYLQKCQDALNELRKQNKENHQKEIEAMENKKCCC